MPKSKPSSRSVGLLLREAENYATQKDYPEAIRIAIEARNLAKEIQDIALEVDALLLMGRARSDAKDKVGALSAYTQVLALAGDPETRGTIPYHSLLRCLLLWALIAHEIPEFLDAGVLDILNQAAECVKMRGHPDDLVNVLHVRSKVLLALKRYDEALLVAEEGISRKKLMKTEGWGCELWCHLSVYASILCKLGRKTDRTKLLVEMSQTGDGAVRQWALASHAWALYEEGEHLDQAERSARDFLASEPRNTAVLQTLAAVLLRQGRIEDALPIFAEYFTLEGSGPLLTHWHEDLLAFADVVKLSVISPFRKLLSEQTNDRVYAILDHAFGSIETGPTYLENVPSELRSQVKILATQILNPSKDAVFPSAKSG